MNDTDSTRTSGLGNPSEVDPGTHPMPGPYPTDPPTADPAPLSSATTVLSVPVWYCLCGALAGECTCADMVAEWNARAGATHGAARYDRMPSVTGSAA